MTTYLILTVVWTLYMSLENFFFVRPQSRPHPIGFLVLHLLLAPVSFALSITDGILRERVTAAYVAAAGDKKEFEQTDRKKLIG